MQRSLNVQSELQQYTIVYCCTNCDKSTLFKNVAKRFQSNTVLWAFHTIQPSSCFTNDSAKNFAVVTCTYYEQNRWLEPT